MAEGRYFKEALASMVSGAAYMDAVRHWCDAGLSVEEICKKLDFPVSAETVEAAVRAYREEKENGASAYEYVQETDAYGRRSFVRRPAAQGPKGAG